MVLTPEQRKTFEEAARPLIKWLNENCHPHVTALVEPDRAELVEGVSMVRVPDYIRD